MIDRMAKYARFFFLQNKIFMYISLPWKAVGIIFFLNPSYALFTIL